MRLVAKPFSQLNASECYDLLRLRQQVFMLEQSCLYADIDNLDRECLHVLGDNAGQLVAYARILPAGLRFAEVSIGRVITDPAIRNTGLGHELVSFTIRYALRHFRTSTLRISAQAYLESFYQRHGFVVCSTPYDEDDIPHIEMVYEMPNIRNESA